MIDKYVYELTGSSLQSHDEVKKVAGALGLASRDLVKRMDGLKPLFQARNEIVHELDLRDPKRHGDRRRLTRSIESTESEVFPAFAVGQTFIDEVGAAIVE